MENHLTKIYSQAKSDIGQKWYKYMESIKPEGDRLLKAYEDAKLTDDKDLIQETGKEYGQYLREKTYMNDRYKSMLDTTTTKLANVNETALAYLNDKMPKVYSVNYNELSDAMPAGISFDLVDETTVKNLVKDNTKLLPTKKLDISKDKRWNQKAINAQVLQGIIQGESVNKIAARLTPIMDRNRKSAIRNARTMTTSAQNKGRLDSYKAAQDSGVVLKKVWLATNSDRTRAWHSDLNGIELDIDEPFENDYGKIMFPGDPSAHPGNVYNCRCTLTTKIIGFKRKDGSIKHIGENDAFDYAVYDKMNYVSVRDSLSDEDKKAFEKLIYDGSNAYNKENVNSVTAAEYWSNLKAGKIKNNAVEEFLSNTAAAKSNKFEVLVDNVVSKKKPAISDVPLPVVDNKKPTKEGLDLYASFINAGDLNPTYDSSAIHKFAGYDPFNRNDYDPKRADVDKLMSLDTVFSPAKQDEVRYKGSCLTADTINELSGKKEVLHSYSSTTVDRNVMRDYADRALDMDEDEIYYPVYETLNVEKGVPVADTRELLGSDGMRGYEKETTIGRETIWEYGEFKQHGDGDDAYYTVEVAVRKRKR